VCVSACLDHNFRTKIAFKNGVLVYLNALSIKLDGEGHRSKFKVRGRHVSTGMQSIAGKVKLKLGKPAVALCKKQSKM